ncbi:MAG TPA: hypothetical protein VNO31_09420, partial [Umezawaea sp.]|nr:hypothetical protein [Umezawaea sp.]
AKIRTLLALNGEALAHPKCGDRNGKLVCGLLFGHYFDHRDGGILWTNAHRPIVDVQLPDPAAASAKREPRVWNHGDPEPTDRPPVRDAMGDIWTQNAWVTPETIPMMWGYITKKYGPLTEVLDGPAALPQNWTAEADRVESALWGAVDALVANETAGNS